MFCFFSLPALLNVLNLDYRRYWHIAMYWNLPTSRGESQFVWFIRTSRKCHTELNGLFESIDLYSAVEREREGGGEGERGSDKNFSVRREAEGMCYESVAWRWNRSLSSTQLKSTRVRCSSLQYYFVWGATVLHWELKCVGGKPSKSEISASKRKILVARLQYPYRERLWCSVVNVLPAHLNYLWPSFLT